MKESLDFTVQRHQKLREIYIKKERGKIYTSISICLLNLVLAKN